jgi:hypothetical protein
MAMRNVFYYPDNQRVVYFPDKQQPKTILLSMTPEIILPNSIFFSKHALINLLGRFMNLF